MNTFFANWYELSGQLEGFSDDMYNNSLYLHVGIWMVLIPVVLLTIYYYVINAASLSKWWHWLLLVVVIGVINLIIGYSTAYNGIWDVYEQQNLEPGYNVSIDSLTFGLINALWSMVVAFVWSMIIKWGSSTCRRTPF